MQAKNDEKRQEDTKQKKNRKEEDENRITQESLRFIHQHHQMTDYVYTFTPHTTYECKVESNRSGREAHFICMFLYRIFNFYFIYYTIFLLLLPSGV